MSGDSSVVLYAVVGPTEVYEKGTVKPLENPIDDGFLPSVEKMKEILLDSVEEPKQYGWMPWGGGQAHGPFDSFDEALADAKTYVGPGEEKDITINEVFEPDFIDYVMDGCELVEAASQSFDDTHGCGDDHMFDVCSVKEAEEDLKKLFKEWADKHVCPNCSWFMDEDVKITIKGDK
jgi:hypothetical protein